MSREAFVSIAQNPKADYSSPSKVHKLVTRALALQHSHGTSLKSYCSPGMHVVIKPNLVYDKHPMGIEGVQAMLTNANVIKPLIDEILETTHYNCSRISICDVPLQTAYWPDLIRFSGLEYLVRDYYDRGIPIELLDLRREISYLKDGVIVKRIREDRDPRGYTAVNLGMDSELWPIIKNSSNFEIINIF